MMEVDGLRVVKSYREQSKSEVVIPQLAAGLTSDENEASKMPQTEFDKAFYNELLSAFVLQQRSWFAELQRCYACAGSENTDSGFCLRGCATRSIEYHC